MLGASVQDIENLAGVAGVHRQGGCPSDEDRPFLTKRVRVCNESRAARKLIDTVEVARAKETDDGRPHGSAIAKRPLAKGSPVRDSVSEVIGIECSTRGQRLGEIERHLRVVSPSSEAFPSLANEAPQRALERPAFERRSQSVAER